MKMNRRQVLASAIAAAAARPVGAARQTYGPKPRTGPSMEELAKVAAQPVFKREQFKSPVIIKSLELLNAHKDYFVRVRAADGAEGISVCNPPRADYLDRILKNLVFPPFLNKDARDLENLLWEAYRHDDNYKLYGIALWTRWAWV